MAVTYSRVHSPVWSNSNTTGAALSVTVAPTNIGDIMVAGVFNQGGTTVASLSGGGVTTWTRVMAPWVDSESTATTEEWWVGVVTSTGSSSLSVTWNAAVGSHFNEITVQDFHAVGGTGTWIVEATGNQTNATSSLTVTYPTLAATNQPQIYCGYASTPSAISISSNSPAGSVGALTSGNNTFIYNVAYTGTAVTTTLSISSTGSWAIGLTLYQPAAGTAMTVTATQGGASGPANGMAMRLFVLDSAAAVAAQNGASFNQQFTSVTAYTGSITTTQTGSRVYGATSHGNFADTAAAATTVVDDVADATNSERYCTFKATALTGTPGATTLGVTASAVTTGPLAMYEVKAAGTLTEDASSPAVASTTSATAVTSASFSPPPGSLIVALIASDGSTGQTTMALTDSLGTHLNWTEKVKNNPTGGDYAGIWIADVPAAGPAVTSPSMQDPGIPPGRQAPMAFTRTIIAVNESPPNVPLTIVNNAAGGTNGVQTSIANSGGASGTAWDFTTVSGSGAVFQADNTHVPPGHPSPLCYQVATGATAVQCYTGWGSGASGMGNANWSPTWIRFYLYNTVSAPAAQYRLACTFDPLGSSIAAALRHTSPNGFLSTTNSNNGQNGIGALALPVNAWCRIEAMFVPGPQGYSVVQLYTTNIEAPLGSTPDDTFTSSAGSIIAAQGNVRWGQSAGSTANYGPYWFSDVAVSNVGWIGPVGVVSTPVTLTDVAGATEQIVQKMADLQDSFPGSSVDATKWSAFNSVSVSGNVLTEVSPAGSGAGGVINSVNTYDLTGSYLLAQLVSAGTQTTLTQALLKVQLDGSNAAQIFVQNGSLACQADVAGTWSGWYASVSYNAAVHKWLRIRESGGTLFFDWSTDGITWTNLYNYANPFALTSLTASIQDTSNTTSEPASSAQWANVNLPPVPIAAADVAAGVEALAVSATVPLADAGAAVEALTVPAETIPLADAAGGTEALTVAATVPLTERAAGVEAATANATVPLAESAGGTDQVAIAAAVPLTDPGAGAEALAIPSETIPLADAAAAVDVASVSATVPLAEVGAGSETASVAATVPLPEVAAGSEALLSGMPVTFTDVAGAADALSVAVACPVTDAGAAAEVLTGSITAGVSDQAGATDAISVGAAVSLADAGGAVDSINALGSVPLAEVAAGTEALSVSVTLALADQAGSVEYTPISGQVDAAGSIDAVVVSAAVPLAEVAGATDLGLAVLHDSAAGAESLSITVTLPLAEVAGASDAVAVTGAGTPTLADAGGAAEALAVTATLALPDQGAGAEAFSTGQGATPALTDAGGASDSLSVTAAAAVSFVDAGAATESAGAAVVAPAAESAGAAESAAVTATLSLPDRGGAVEALGASVSLPAAETAAATDQAQIAVQAFAGDRAGAAELFGVSKPVGLAEAAAAADSLAVHVALSFGPMPTFTPEPADPVWMAYPDRPEWSSEAVAVRWTAVIEAGEWAADAAPMRWRIVMGVFEPIAAVSLENINARWTSDQDGVVIDPVAQSLPVQFAFPVSSGDENHPAPPATWYPGVWVTPNGTAKGFLAQCMVGTGGVVTLTRGQSYDVWCKITTATEAPAKFVGVQAVY